MKVAASAPSNIALIKYMGKTDSANNLPANASLSWTLEALRTQVEIEFDPTLTADEWSPLIAPGFEKMELSEKGQAKFLKQVARIRADLQKQTQNHAPMKAQAYFRIQSANNFPSDCGIASSASSFAALTKATYAMYEAMDSSFRAPEVSKQAEMSRLGSGSSCRSFFTPWSIWDAKGARAAELNVTGLHHQVLLVDDRKKNVSSSEAHVRCLTSELFRGRPERAETRLRSLLSAFREGEWQRAYQLTWAELWDMHALFETAVPHFGYMSPGSLKVLDEVRDLWETRKDGPLVTMDAGANVHLLWRAEQKNSATAFEQGMRHQFKILSSGTST